MTNTPKTNDVGMDRVPRSNGRWTVYLYGNYAPANGPKFLAEATYLKARKIAMGEATISGGAVFIEGQPEAEFLPEWEAR